MDKLIHILSIDIQNEMDIILAHRRGMQLARFSGVSLSEQTRFATAVSEISRNALEYAGHGVIKFEIILAHEQSLLTATVSDKGPGIDKLSNILERNPELHKGRGLGIVFARRLADSFSIKSDNAGTIVIIQKFIPIKAPLLSKLVIQGWLQHIEKEPVISAYEELKMRNIQLVELTEELRTNAKMVQSQMEEISKLNDQLHNSNDRMKEFTYAVSHDLKTPLSTLKMASDYLEQNPGGDEAVVYQSILSRSVKRLDKTVRSLIEILDLQDKGKQIIKHLEFETVFSNAKDEYGQFIDEADAEIETDFSLAPDIHYIEGYLQSLFNNLLSNAIKYRSGNRRLQIKAVTRKHDKNILLVFSDNGSGMDLSMISERVFTPFARFSEQSEGKGIGLFLIKSMVENNGGSVIVESEVDLGTTFRFLLVPYKSSPSS